MKKFVLFAVIISVLFLVAGAGLTAYAMHRKEFNSTMGKDVVKTYEFENFDDININVEISDITITYVEGTKCVVECHEKEKVAHVVNVENNTLKVTQNDTRKWYQKIFNFNNKISADIKLPKNNYNNVVIKSSTGNLTINKGMTYEALELNSETGNVYLQSNVNSVTNVKTSTGNVRIEEAEIKGLELKTSTGNVILKNLTLTDDISYLGSTGSISLTNVNMNNVKIEVSTGDVSFDNSIAKGNLDVKTSTGNITLTLSDAANMKLKTSTGNVKGSILSDKVFTTKTSTGKQQVPASVSGAGTCDIETSTGNIIIEVKKA